MSKDNTFEDSLKVIHIIFLALALGCFLGYLKGKHDVQEKLDSAYLLASDNCKEEIDAANDLRNMALDKEY